MRVRKWLPLAAIKVDKLPYNRTTFDLANQIRNAGGSVIIPPVKVQKRWVGYWLNKGDNTWRMVGHYEYHMCDGRHRYAAYKILGRPSIEVIYGEP